MKLLPVTQGEYMQRGVVDFSPDNINFLLPKLQESPQDTALLQQKLQHALQSGGDTHIELSEDETDTLLDCLPSPHEGEDQSIFKLRTKLTDFLQKMRLPQDVNGGSGLMTKLNPANWFKK